MVNQCMMNKFQVIPKSIEYESNMVYNVLSYEKLICRGKPVIPFGKKPPYLTSDWIVFFYQF